MLYHPLALAILEDVVSHINHVCCLIVADGMALSAHAESRLVEGRGGVHRMPLAPNDRARDRSSSMPS
jgi:hypothetical protein